MPIDPRIALGVQPMQIQQPDPNAGMNALARAMQIGGMMDEQKVNSLKVQEAQRGIDRRNKLEGLLGQEYAKPEERESALMRGGFMDEATKLANDRRANLKSDAETDAKRIETAHKRVDAWGQAMGFVRQNPTAQNAAAAVNHLVNMGIMPREQAQAALAGISTDPQGIAQWATQGFQAALSAKDQLPKYDTRNLGGTTQMTAADPVTGQVRVVNSAQNTQSPDNAASNARMAADAAASRAQSERHFQSNQAAGKAPAGYRFKADGSLEFIPGGPADPNAAKKAAPTEFQGKSAMFGSRAQEADRIITELTGKYSPAAVNTKTAAGNVWGVGGVLEAGANLALSQESQKAEQAQRDFVNAVLRLESGAAIGKDEFNNAKRQYFPQPGDGPDVIAQKEVNRKRAVDGLMYNARTSAVEPAKPQSGGATGNWTPGKPIAPGATIKFDANGNPI